MQFVHINIAFLFPLYVQFLDTGNALELPGNFSAQEIQAINKLKPIVSKYLYKDYMKDNHYLIRFLRSKNLNIESTKQALLQMVTWRKQNRVDTILNQTLDIEKLMHYTITHDRIGRPVLTVRIAEWHFRRIILAGRAKEIELGIYKLYELGIDNTRKATTVTGTPVSEVVILVDMTGYNSREHGCILCLRLYVEVFTTYENYYPWLIHKMILVNSPRGYDVVWNAAKPALSKHTRDSVAIYGFDKGEWKQVISELIAEDQIPTFMGGTFKAKTTLTAEVFEVEH